MHRTVRVICCGRPSRSWSLEVRRKAEQGSEQLEGEVQEQSLNDRPSSAPLAYSALATSRSVVRCEADIN